MYLGAATSRTTVMPLLVKLFVSCFHDRDFNGVYSKQLPGWKVDYKTGLSSNLLDTIMTQRSGASFRDFDWRAYSRKKSPTAHTAVARGRSPEPWEIRISGSALPDAATVSRNRANNLPTE